MKYVEQTHKDLRLYILDQEAPKESFTLISESKFKVDDIDVEFGILAESHFVSIKSQAGEITEICACTDFNVDNLFSSLLTDIGDANKVTETDTLRHKFTYKVNNLAVGEVKLKALQSKRAHPYSHYLEHYFPTSKPGEISPLTEVYVTVDDAILIESVHTYPNKGAMVFTNSVITKK